jgi:hypothetical protein
MHGLVGQGLAASSLTVSEDTITDHEIARVLEGIGQVLVK